MNIIDTTLQLDNTPWRLYEVDGDRQWCVLWLQGFTSTIEGHEPGVRRLVEATHVSFAMLNYAGHGNHPVTLDDATREQQFSEVVDVYDELQRRGYQKIIVIGGSFGGYMAALLANVRPIETLVLRAPANYMEEEFELPYKETAAGRKDNQHYLYRKSIDEQYTNNAVESVRNFDGRTYVIEHEKDEVVQAAIPRSYFNAAKHGNYVVIPGVAHSPKSMPNQEKYFALIELWLATIIRATTLGNDVDL